MCSQGFRVSWFRRLRLSILFRLCSALALVSALHGGLISEMYLAFALLNSISLFKLTKID